MLAMPGFMGIVPGGHVPVHVVGGLGGGGGADGMKPPTCIGGNCCCWFWVCANCCVVVGGVGGNSILGISILGGCKVGGVGGGICCICLVISSVVFLTM